MATALTIGACSGGTTNDSVSGSSSSESAAVVRRSAERDLLGKWILTRYEVDGDERRLPSATVYVVFDDHGRVGGNDGTNTLSGQYALQGKVLAVDDVTSTLAAPPASGPLHNSAAALWTLFLSKSGDEGPSVTDVRVSGKTMTIARGPALLRFAQH